MATSLTYFYLIHSQSKNPFSAAGYVIISKALLRLGLQVAKNATVVSNEATNSAMFARVLKHALFFQYVSYYYLLF
jgi:hypothetical protein